MMGRAGVSALVFSTDSALVEAVGSLPVSAVLARSGRVVVASSSSATSSSRYFPLAVRSTSSVTSYWSSSVLSARVSVFSESVSSLRDRGVVTRRSSTVLVSLAAGSPPTLPNVVAGRVSARAVLASGVFSADLADVSFQ